MNAAQTQDTFDYSYVDATARIALYDDLKSAPRVTEIPPATTNEFIEHLTTAIYEQSKLVGGKVPYTLIREVSENFIHAQFKEIVVSILDNGNTIRFADQGPGIQEKEKAQQPGFSSAIEPMKKYIRGVGSGFPLVKDYLDNSEGSIQIEDNLVSGAVITISLEQNRSHQDQIGFYQPGQYQPTGTQAEASQPAAWQPRDTSRQTYAPNRSNAAPAAYATSPYGQQNHAGAYANQQVLISHGGVPAALIPQPLSDREKLFILALFREGDLGVTDLKNITDTPGSTTFNTLKKLEEMGIVQKAAGKKRALTDFGYEVAAQIS